MAFDPTESLQAVREGGSDRLKMSSKFNRGCKLEVRKDTDTIPGMIVPEKAAVCSEDGWYRAECVPVKDVLSRGRFLFAACPIRRL